jgi:hypothetical protein
VELEANIRGGGKSVRVVFKYQSKSLLVKWGGGGGSNARHHPTSQHDPWIFLFSDDITVLLLLGVSFDAGACNAPYVQQLLTGCD